MKARIDRFSFPDDLEKRVRVSKLWESDELEPLLVSVVKDEGGFDYQVSLEADATSEFGRAGRRLAGEDVTGKEWEAAFRSFLRTEIPELEPAVDGDSDDETMCLWVRNQEVFTVLLHAVWAFFNEPASHSSQRLQ